MSRGTRRTTAGTRMFVALIPPPAAVAHLEEFLEPRREHAAFRWSSPEQFHVTLAFADAVPDTRVEDVVERLHEVWQRRGPIETRIAGGGAFPDPATARVLYAGLELEPEGREQLAGWSRAARSALDRSGVPVDGGRFRPHMTLARLNRPVEVTRWVRLLDAYQGPVWRADHVALMASHLGEGPRGRPRYEPVAVWDLSG